MLQTDSQKSLKKRLRKVYMLETDPRKSARDLDKPTLEEPRPLSFHSAKTELGQSPFHSLVSLLDGF